ncbi:MAG: Connector [Bacteriophage sp.]|nr:MAG: Connector [Bacteriophage sp.]
MKRKENIYQRFQSYVKNKDTAVMAFIENTLAKTQAMFVYEGLPDTVPAEELERLLQTEGNAFFAEVNGDLYALQGAAGGEPDPYNRPTIYTVANPALKLNKSYKIGVDGVFIKNDTNGNSLLPIIGKFAVLYTDGIISLNTASILTRITMLISASDDKTKQSADEFLKKILDGDFSVIGENAFFKGVNMQTAATSNTQYITQLVELVQYYKANMLNELGLNANYNMKRERLNTGEVAMNVDVLLPYVDNMLHERQKALKQVNEMFGTEITVRLGSSWYLEHENYESLVTGVEVVTEEERENDPTNEETDTDQPAPTEEQQEQTEQTEQQEQQERTEDTEQTEEPEQTEQTEDGNEQEQQEQSETEDTEETDQQEQDEDQPADEDEDTEEQRKKKGGKK